jgi:hypothetical protein
VNCCAIRAFAQPPLSWRLAGPAVEGAGKVSGFEIPEFEGQGGGATRSMPVSPARSPSLIMCSTTPPASGPIRRATSYRTIRTRAQRAACSLGTHDYLSGAVELDNGQDLTYLWSSSLPIGTAFRCPIVWWDM